ncbi:MAG: hypothetical protein M0P39_11500 [Rhodocyclaceae bacterium]|nr:hypothetical protein [Rhodocyclaceae bacterium]
MAVSEARIFFAAKRPATPHCFDFAARSLRAAEIQISRIWDRPVVSGSHSAVEAAFHDILIDVHFYFVSLRNVYRFLVKVVEDPAFEHFKPEVARLNDTWFRHYAKGREAFEHIDQRLPGEKQEHQLVEVTADGSDPRKIHYGLSLHGGIFRHSDLSFDISRDAFSRIRSEVEALFVKIEESCPPKEEIRAV